MTTEFLRRPTEEERRNFINISDAQENALTRFKKTIELEEKKQNKNKKPFCQRCAKLDFQDHIQAKITELERTNGYADFTHLTLHPPTNMEDYSNIDRFQHLQDQDAMEPVGMAESGKIQRKIKIGIHRDYKCKKRGCGISIFISNEELATEKTEKKKA